MYEGSDTTEGSPAYTKGDIVWVKLSSYWWPGEVINEDDLPGDLLSDFKKPPLAIVKFFDEDSYEYVRNWSNIYPYNCNKKSEFIQKGMAGFRSKLSHMAKFPKDIGTAEEKTNGNPNILSQPEFLPVKKINYDEIFGTPSPKKSAKGKTLPTTKKTPSRENNQPHITHRRFLGNDDYRAYICIQYPGKDRKWDSDDEEIKKLNEEPEKLLTCQSCSFKTKRLEVMILHTKMHIKGIYVTSKRKTKKAKDPELSGSESDNVAAKSPKPKQRKKKEVKSQATDVFTNLLEEWNDTDEEMEETQKKSPKTKKKGAELAKVSSDNEKVENEDEKEDQENESTKNRVSESRDVTELDKTQLSIKDTHDDIKNCFDFDEEEEDDDIMMPTSAGRKIPRVIPEKPKPSISELLEQSQKEDELEKEKKSDAVGIAEKEVESLPPKEQDATKKEILRMSQSFNREPDVDDNIENTFKELMAETELPPIDDLTQTLKPEQNFHDARTIKFPDKGGTTLKGGTVPKVGTSAKRFVTSFEDFEAGFRKIENEETLKKLERDKEVKATKMPKSNRIPNEDDGDSSSSKPTDETVEKSQPLMDVWTGAVEVSKDIGEVPQDTVRVSKDTIEVANDTVEVPKDIVEVAKDIVEVSKDTVDTPSNIAEAPQSTNKKLQTARHSKTIKETNLKEVVEPESPVKPSQPVEQMDVKDSDKVSTRRKTRNSAQKESKENEMDLRAKEQSENQNILPEIPAESRRKSSRRRTKQFVIEEDSEEIIEITKECDSDSLIDSAEYVVSQLDESAREKLAAMDSEIEALKRSLDSSQSVTQEDEGSQETEIISESRPDAVVKPDDPELVGNSENTNLGLPEEIVGTSAQIEVVQDSQMSNSQELEHLASQRRSKRRSRAILKDKGEEIVHKERHMAKEMPNKAERKVSQRKSSKEEPLDAPVEDLAAKPSLKNSGVETVELTLTDSDPVALIHEESGLKEGTDQSETRQEDQEIQSERKEIPKSSKSDLGVAKSNIVEFPENTDDILRNSTANESVTALDESALKEKIETTICHSKQTPVSTSSIDQDMEVLQEAKTGNMDEPKGPEILEGFVESNKTLQESNAPEQTPRSRRGKTRKHSKEQQGSKHFLEEITLENKEHEHVEKATETLQATEGQNSVSEPVFSGSGIEVCESLTPKIRRGRSQKYCKEEQILVAEPKQSLESKQKENAVTDAALLDCIDPPANTDHMAKTRDELISKSRGRSRKHSKEKEPNSSFLNEQTLKYVEVDLKQAENPSADKLVPDISSDFVSEGDKDIGPRSQKNRTRKDAKEQDIKIPVEEQGLKEKKVFESIDAATTTSSVSEQNIDSEQIICVSSVDMPPDQTSKTRRKVMKTKGEDKQMPMDLTGSTLKNEELHTEPKSVADKIGPEVVEKPILESVDEKTVSSKTKKSRSRKHVKTDEQVWNTVEEKVPKNKTLERLEAKEVTADQILQVQTSQNNFSEQNLSAKDEIQVGVSFQESTFTDVQQNQEEAVTDIGNELNENKNLKLDLILSNSDTEKPDVLTPKSRRGRSRKHTNEEEVEPEPKPESTASKSSALPTEIPSIVSEPTPISEVPKYSTPKTRKNRSRKHHKGEDISETESKEFSESKTIDPLVAILKEPFPKTRRGRSRQQTREEEDIARAIEESLKDAAAQSIHMDDTVDSIMPEAKQPAETKNSAAKPVLFGSAEKLDKFSPRTRKGKSRKYSKEKEPASTVSEQKQSEAQAEPVFSEIIQSDENQSYVSDSIFSDSASSISKEFPEAKIDESGTPFKNEGDSILNKSSVPDFDVECSQVLEPTALKPISAEQSANTRKGKTRKHSKEEQVLIATDEAGKIKDLTPEPTEEVSAALTELATSLNTVSETIISDSAGRKPELSTPKAKKGRRRTHRKDEDHISTDTEVLSEVEVPKPSEKCMVALASTQPAIELSESSQILLESVLPESSETIISDPVGKLPELATPKAKKSRRRTHTKDEDCVSTDTEVLSKVEDAKPGEKFTSLESSQPAVELSESSQIELESVLSESSENILSDSVGKILEQSTPKAKKGRRRTHTKDEDRVSTDTEVLSKVEDAKPGEKFTSLESSEPAVELSESSQIELESVLSESSENILSDSVGKILDQPTPKAKKGRRRTHTKDEDRVSTDTEVLSKVEDAKPGEKFTSLESSQPAVELSESSQIELESALSESSENILSDSVGKILEQPTPKAKKGRRRTHTKDEDRVSTDTEVLFKVEDAKPGEKFTSLEFSQPAVELSESSQIELESALSESSENILSDSVGKILDQPTPKAKKGRRRTHTKDEDRVSTDTEVLSKVEDAKPGEKFTSLESSQPAVELSESSQIELESVLSESSENIISDSVGKMLELPTPKAKKGRRRTHTKDEDRVSTGTEVLSKVEVAKPSEKNTIALASIQPAVELPESPQIILESALPESSETTISDSVGKILELPTARVKKGRQRTHMKVEEGVSTDTEVPSKVEDAKPSEKNTIALASIQPAVELSESPQILLESALPESSETTISDSVGKMLELPTARVKKGRRRTHTKVEEGVSTDTEVPSKVEDAKPSEKNTIALASIQPAVELSKSPQIESESVLSGSDTIISDSIGKMHQLPSSKAKKGRRRTHTKDQDPDSTNTEVLFKVEDAKPAEKFTTVSPSIQPSVELSESSQTVLESVLPESSVKISEESVPKHKKGRSRKHMTEQAGAAFQKNKSKKTTPHLPPVEVATVLISEKDVEHTSDDKITQVSTSKSRQVKARKHKISEDPVAVSEDSVKNSISEFKESGEVWAPDTQNISSEIISSKSDEFIPKNKRRKFVEEHDLVNLDEHISKDVVLKPKERKESEIDENDSPILDPVVLEVSEGLNVISKRSGSRIHLKNDKPGSAFIEESPEEKAGVIDESGKIQKSPIDIVKLSGLSNEQAQNRLDEITSQILEPEPMRETPQAETKSDEVGKNISEPVDKISEENASRQQMDRPTKHHRKENEQIDVVVEEKSHEPSTIDLYAFETAKQQLNESDPAKQSVNLNTEISQHLNVEKEIASAAEKIILKPNEFDVSLVESIIPTTVERRFVDSDTISKSGSASAAEIATREEPKMEESSINDIVNQRELSKTEVLKDRLSVEQIEHEQTVIEEEKLEETHKSDMNDLDHCNKSVEITEFNKLHSDIFLEEEAVSSNQHCAVETLIGNSEEPVTKESVFPILDPIHMERVTEEIDAIESNKFSDANKLQSIKMAEPVNEYNDKIFDSKKPESNIADNAVSLIENSNEPFAKSVSQDVLDKGDVDMIEDQAKNKAQETIESNNSDISRAEINTSVLGPEISEINNVESKITLDTKFKKSFDQSNEPSRTSWLDRFEECENNYRKNQNNDFKEELRSVFKSDDMEMETSIPECEDGDFTSSSQTSGNQDRESGKKEVTDVSLSNIIGNNLDFSLAHDTVASVSSQRNTESDEIYEKISPPSEELQTIFKTLVQPSDVSPESVEQAPEVSNFQEVVEKDILHNLSKPFTENIDDTCSTKEIPLKAESIVNSEVSSINKNQEPASDVHDERVLQTNKSEGSSIVINEDIVPKIRETPEDKHESRFELKIAQEFSAQLNREIVKRAGQEMVEGMIISPEVNEMAEVKSEVSPTKSENAEPDNNKISISEIGSVEPAGSTDKQLVSFIGINMEHPTDKSQPILSDEERRERSKKYSCATESSNKTEHVEKPLEGATDEELVKEKRQRKASKDTNIEIGQEKRPGIGPKELDTSLEEKLSQEQPKGRVEGSLNKRRRSRRYSRQESTSTSEEKLSEDVINVIKAMEEPDNNEETSSFQDDKKELFESSKRDKEKTRKFSSSSVERKEVGESYRYEKIHDTDSAVSEKKEKGRFKNYSRTETDLPEDKPTTEKHVSDDVLPKVSDQKRSVPPKKNRWSRRDSYSNKDEDAKKDNLTLQKQMVQNTTEIANDEVVIEEKIVDIKDSVIEISKILNESECAVDLSENKNSENPTVIPENSFADLNDSEIILPPKKSKRANELNFNFLSDTFSSSTFLLEKKSDSDNLSFPSCDDSIMSTSLRNNIEGLIKDIDSFDNSCVSDNFERQTESDGVSTSNILKVKEARSEDISKCIPPKKKKIQFSKLESSVISVNSLLQNDGKPAETIPQPPKKKIQKLFESSQAFEKFGKTVDIPLMSPLAKKKSFLFHQEEFLQNQMADISQPSEIKGSEKSDLDKIALETIPPNTTELKSAEAELCSLEGKGDDDDANKCSTLPKKRKKRKSSHVEHSQRKERRTSFETIDTIDEHDSKHKFKFIDEQIASQPQDEKCVPETPKCSTANNSVPSTPMEDKVHVKDDHNNEMEVKLEEEDFKFCIQTNLTNLETSTAEELSAIATATLSEIKNEVIVDSSSPVVEVTLKKNEQIKETSPVVKEEVVEPKIKKEETVAPLEPNKPEGIEAPSEPEFVPISLNPTIMSEKDLADSQVEITTDKVISEKKPTSVGMFSMDFLESSQPSISAVSYKLKRKDTAGVGSPKMTNTLGTEFTSKAMTKEFDNRALMAQPKAYAFKSELLDILEGNSNSSTNSSGSEQKFKTSFDNYDKKTTVQGMFDFEEAIPSQIVLSNKVNPETVLMDSPKLLERLSMSTEAAKLKSKKVLIQSDIKVAEGIPKAVITKVTKTTGIPKPGQKIVIKTTKAQMAAASKAAGNKPIILSEQIIRPANALKTAKTAIQPQGMKRQYEDIEDVEAAFIIPKIAKKSVEEEVIPVTPEKPPSRARHSKGSGKAKIIQQTIITPKGEIIQPQAPSTTKSTTSAQIQSAQSQPDDTVFDINSMPIVISDDLLTPESIQNMPVVLSEDVVSQNKSVAVKTEEKVAPVSSKKVPNVAKNQQIVFKTTQPGSTAMVPAKQMVKPRILSTAATPTSKLPKPGTTALLATGTSADGKPTKYVLVPSTVTSTVPQVKAVKPAVVKKQTSVQSKMPNIQLSEPPSQVVGNKIMIVTNQHGQQTRVVLTPQQQKAFMQAQPGSKTKAIIKGAIPKGLLESTAAGPSGIPQKPALPSIPQGATPTVPSQGGLLMTVGKSVKTPVQPKRTTQKTPSKPQKTILIKNQLGQTVRKIQGTDDADLDRQVMEQLEAIKASARLQQANKSPEIINYTNRHIPSSSSSISKTAVRRSYSKKVEPIKVKPTVSTPQAQPQKSPETLVPALAPLSPQLRIPQIQSQTSPTIPKQASPNKLEPAPLSPVSRAIDTALQQQAAVASKSETKVSASSTTGAENKPTDRPLTQLVIQDGLGNQTTITEGQILAIPSETVDGQPQSYMLVTLDEMGNITPLNNEALMSLDPSLGLGGDLNNMVLQVDQGQGTVAALKSIDPNAATVPIVSAVDQKMVEERLKSEQPKILQPTKTSKAAHVEQPKPQDVPLVEQQIVIGEGVLPGADAGGQQLIVTGDPIATQKFLESLSDGSTDLANILANAEGGSVLIQADGQQILIKTNAGSQSMLGIAENTEGSGNPMFGTHKPNQDILAAALANTDVFPPSDQTVVHPSTVKSLPSSQLSPSSGAGVLYPMHVGNVLETSLTLSSPIMTPLEVPSINSKKIDDEADILNQVPKNVDLPITITDPNISQTVAQQQAIGLMELTLPISESTGSTDINSPSYSYSLPSLEDSVGIAQKPFNGSMPLLTEDITEVENGASSQMGKIRIAKGLQCSESNFGSNFGSLPMLTQTIESSREEVVKTSCFGEIGSLPMLSEDVIEDSGSSIGSSKPARSSPKAIERDIVDEGLSTLGGEMCSSLSEPPPDMFDLTSITAKEEEISSDLSSIPEPEGETLSLHSENSEEIPIQPPIVANLNDLKRPGEETHEQDEKRQKFD